MYHLLTHKNKIKDKLNKMHICLHKLPILLPPIYRNLEKNISIQRNKRKSVKKFGNFYVAVSPSSCSSLEEPQTRHLQHTMQGAANNSKGDATSKSRPKPANIPITCVRCHITDARECPNLFLHGPLS